MSTYFTFVSAKKLAISDFYQAWLHFQEHRDNNIIYSCDDGQVQFDIQPVRPNGKSYDVIITNLMCVNGDNSRINLKGLLTYIIDYYENDNGEEFMSELILKDCASRYGWFDLNHFRYGNFVFKKKGDDLVLVTDDIEDPASDLQDW